MPQRLDKYILYAALFLILVGFIAILSASPISAAHQYGDGLYYVKRQFISLLIGLLVCFVMTKLDYRLLRFLAAPGLFISLFLLVLTYIPTFSVNAGGASRWIRLGLLSFQPAELVKVFIIIYIAQAVVQKKYVIKDFLRGLLPLLLVSGIFILGILGQPDLGTSLVVTVVVLIMFIVAGCNLADLFLLSLIGFRALFFWIERNPYQLKRLLVFFNPAEDRFGAGYHIWQSLIAVGSGGLFGLGLGQSRQKFAYLPENHTDFIFAVICEEGGIIWGGLVVLAFAVLVLRGIRLSTRVEDPFGAFLALGFSLCLGIQAIVNMMVTTALLPTKGITLPFVSSGGSSLIVSLFMLGVILRVSREAQSRKIQNAKQVYGI